MKRLPFLSLLFLALLGAGCASYRTSVEHGRSLDGVKRYFVIRNLNDNHAIDHLIATSLENRGATAETGPLTMMDDDTQAVISFQDNWAWDFGEHLVHLQISVRDRKSNQPFATVNFNAKFPVRKTTAEIVDDLVGRLLDGRKG